MLPLLSMLAEITASIMKGRHAVIRGVADATFPRSVARSFTFFYKPTIVTVFLREGRGHPGYRVKCLETGMEFVSQFEAARAHGFYPSLMSGHLNGKFSDLDGLHFERI